MLGTPPTAFGAALAALVPLGPACSSGGDLVTNLPGAETTKSIYSDCEAGVAAELWTIHGGPHSPAFSDAWAPSVLDFLLAHPKP